MSSVAFDPFAINGPDDVAAVNESSMTFPQFSGQHRHHKDRYQYQKLEDKVEVKRQQRQAKDKHPTNRSLTSTGGVAQSLQNSSNMDISSFSAPVLYRDVNSSVDTDIYSSLFTSSSNLNQSAHQNQPRIHNSNSYSIDESFQSHNQSTVVYTGDSPVHVALHESMCCVYDNSTKFTSMTIEGAINVQLSPEIMGRSIYLSMQDSSKHIGDLTSFFDYVTEFRNGSASRSGVRDVDDFVVREQRNGHRVFRVDVPVILDAKEINIIKYTGSELLRPIPLLVNSKIQMASKYCKVRIKIRSNPSNKQPIRSIGILVAVPPSIDGETLKMFTGGGHWDPMKRIVVWSAPALESGETMEMQMQFEMLSSVLSASDSKEIPPTNFPILVRCDAVQDQLSNIKIRIGGERQHQVSGQDDSVNDSLLLLKSYRLFHRKM